MRPISLRFSARVANSRVGYPRGSSATSGIALFIGQAFIVGAVVMVVGGIAELFLGVRSERGSLEDIAKPLTAQEADVEQVLDQEIQVLACALSEHGAGRLIQPRAPLTRQ